MGAISHHFTFKPQCLFIPGIILLKAWMGGGWLAKQTPEWNRGTVFTKHFKSKSCVHTQLNIPNMFMLFCSSPCFHIGPHYQEKNSQVNFISLQLWVQKLRMKETHSPHILIPCGLSVVGTNYYTKLGLKIVTGSVSIPFLAVLTSFF